MEVNELRSARGISVPAPQVGPPASTQAQGSILIIILQSCLARDLIQPLYSRIYDTACPLKINEHMAPTSQWQATVFAFRYPTRERLPSSWTVKL